MAIAYDNLNAAKAVLRTLREEFLDGVITNAERLEQEAKIKNDIRVILGFAPLTP
jgi:hypothetical protein